MFLGVSLSLTGQLRAGVSAYAIGSFEPELVFDFEQEYYRTGGTQTTFDSAMTLDRSSNATMVDSDGLLKWAPHNLVTYSEDFSNASWNKQGSGTGSAPVVTANTAIAPDGNPAADRIQFDQGAGTSSADFSLVSGTTISTEALYTRGIWLKSNTAENYIILAYGTGNSTGIEWTVTPEWQLFKLGTNSDYSNSSQDKVGGGNFIFGLRGGAGVQYFMGTNTSQSADILAWGAHLYRSDLGGMVDNPDRGDSYVPTTSAARYLPRRGHHVYNGAEWVNEGVLVEPSAGTNLQSYSVPDSNWNAGSVAITENASGVTSPDGGENWSLIKEFAASNVHFAVGENNISYTSGTAYTISVFVKKASTDDLIQLTFPSGVFGASQYANFNAGTGAFETVVGLTTHVEDFGGGIYRVGITASATATASSTTGLALTNNNDGLGRVPSYLGDATQGFYIWGFQVEQGSVPSSYIPTSGSTVTRAADTLTVPSANLPWPTPNVIGPELVTNGTFDTDVSGWAGVNATLASVDGQLQITDAGGYASARQVLSTNVGSVYSVKLDIVATNINVDAYNGSDFTATPPDISIASSLNTGSYELFFVAQDTSTTLSIRGNSADGFVYTFDNISVREIDPLAVSIQMQGRATGDTLTTTRWYLDANNYITQEINTSDFTFEQANAGTVDAVTGGSFTSGVNTSFNIASTHASTLVAAAVGGTALVDNTTPTALADLSSTDMALAYSGGPMILKKVRMWPANITEAGREEASA